jgi:GNAT superfamily N-acetyltransferase
VVQNRIVQVFSQPMAFAQDFLRNGPTRLRTLESGDTDWLLRWENDPSHWIVSGTTIPYSRSVLQKLCDGHQDLYIGILVDPDHRGQGTGGRAMEIAVRHARQVLLLRSLHAEVHADNSASMQLFEGCGFEEVGRYADWTRTENGWRDAALFQLILNPDQP